VRLLIARHGQTDWNLARRYQGQSDSHLTALGEAQARLLGERLAREPIDAAYASDLERAWRTAEIALAGRAIPIRRDPAWRELCYGAWEGLTRAEIAARDPERYRRRTEDRLNVAPPGGETMRELSARVRAAVERLRARHAGERVLVITHSGPLHALICALEGRDLGAFVTSHNCALSCFRWEGAVGAVEFWDDAAHLQQLTAPLVGEAAG
jgi:probable phosphoglycerate mutase